MNILIVLAFIILVGTIYTQRNGSSHPSRTTEKNSSIATQTPTDTPRASMRTTPSPWSNTPTNSPKASQKNSLAIQLFLYPSSRVKSSTDTSLNLESSDGPDAITSWYKEKIMERGMTSRSFVQTKTNDIVHNVLTASDHQQTIRVVVTKNPGESSTSIAVTR